VRKRWILTIAAIAALSVVAAACTSEEEPAPAEVEMPDMTIAEVVADSPDFSTLLTAVEAADLAETLSGEGPYTVFAPTDEAFAALPDGALDSLLEPSSKDDLAGILTYHVVAGEIMAADVEPGEVPTVNGESFTISTQDGGVVITDGTGGEAQVVTTDVPASNGVIHVIDAVLLP
jgi:uncharacterized surface protein with fasciclin (FAS1) repeats